MALKYLDIQRDIEPIRERIGDGLVGRDRDNANPRCVPVCGHVNALVVTVFSLRPPEVEVAMINVAVGDRQHLVLVCGRFHDGATEVRLGSVLSRAILKANLAVPGITSCLPRLGNRMSSCSPGRIVDLLWGITTDCHTPLTPRGSRRRRYGSSFLPNLLEDIVI